MSGAPAVPPPSPHPTGERGPLAEVVLLFLKLGFTAFGGPAAHIAMMREEVVRRRRWVTDQRFLDLLGVVNLIPGPNSTELAIHLGYVRAGWPGLVAAGVMFIGPATAIVLALAWAYGAYGSLPQATGFLYGVKPVIMAIIAQALWGLARTALARPLAVAFALATLILYLLGGNEIALLFGMGFLYALVRRAQDRLGVRFGRGPGRDLGILAPALPLVGVSREVGAGVAATPVAAGMAVAGASGATGATAATSAAVPFLLGTLFLTFLKIGAVLYGSGYVLLAFLRRDFVDRLGWLSDRQLLDAISIGQFTPGPVFTTATFVGYLVGGWSGALLATLGIFLPSFVFVAAIHPLAEVLRRHPVTASLLDGVNVAALALMAGVAVQLGRTALVDPLTWVLALAALFALVRFSVNSAWWLALGGAVGLAVTVLR
ncbi:MAG: chromate efflux transporter [Clostridia bacterium]|nr:chromate efflux transporter [Clostridia bacterium]